MKRLTFGVSLLWEKGQPGTSRIAASWIAKVSRSEDLDRRVQHESD